MLIIQNISIDFLRTTNLEPVEVMQFDANTRGVKASLLYGGNAWIPPENISASLAFKKPDGTSGWYDRLPDDTVACTIDKNTVTAIFAPQMLTSIGEVMSTVIFQDENLNQLATFSFSVYVKENPSSSNGISNVYYKYTTMEAVNKAVDAALSELETSKQDFLDKAVEVLEVVKDTATEDSPAIICEETGEIISVSDSSNRTLAGLTIYGKTTQNGTPTPEAPVELVSAGASGAIKTTVTGKNIFGGRVLADKMTELAGVTKNEVAGSITFNANQTGSKGVFNRFEAGKKYTIMVYGKNSVSTANHCNLAFYYGDKTYDMLKFKTAGENSYCVATSNGNKTLAGVGPIQATGSTTLYYDKCGIFEGELTEADFEPYKGDTITASTPNGLPGIPVSSGGNYTDENGQQWVCDEIDFARGVYVKRVGNYVFNGSEAWEVQNNAWFFHRMSDAYTDIDPLFMSNVGRVPQANLASGYGFAYAYGARIKFENMNPMSGNTVDELKAYLAEKPITMVVRLKTPIETALSAEELAAYAALHSNKPNTTVYNDAGAGLGVEYVADTKNYIDNKFTELQNAILSAGANI